MMKKILPREFKKTLILSIGFNAIFNFTFAVPLSGTYTVGAAGNYTTIKLAIDALNTNGVSGAVIFSLIDNTYAYTNTGATQATCMWIGASASPGGVTGTSSVNTVTFKPAATKSPVITVTAGANSQAGFTLNGADYMIFDGSNTSGGTTHDMTIQMAGNFTTRVFDIKDPGVGGGSTNNVIKNCIITGYSNASSNYGIYLRNSSGTGTNENINNTFENNEITQTFYGIWFSGLSTGGLSTGNIVKSNVIGSSAATTTYVACKGVYAQYETSLEVSENHIYNILSNTTIIVSGIDIERSTSVSVSKNKIHDIGYTGVLGYGGKGINSNTTLVNPGITITNNFISGIVGDGTAGTISSAPAAIYIGWTTTAPTTGISVCFNSIYLTPNTSYGLNFDAGVKAIGIYVQATSSGLTMCSNIFRASLGEKTGCAFVSNGYAVYTDAVATPFATCDYNIYYTTGQDNNYVGYGNGATCTLAQWKTFTGQDVNSLNQDPKFISTTDLHIQATFFVSGAACSAITTDIDGQTRTFPRIGADENASSLPIELISFTAALNADNKTLCQWTTASETNNDYYVVERTRDGINYDFVTQMNGVGNSNATSYYSTIDPNPYSGTSYYRLKQVDFNGSYTYSQLVSVNLDNIEIISIYPNPASYNFNYLIGSTKGGIVTVTVINALGQSILSVQENTDIGINNKQLNVTSLVKGVYVLRITTQEKEQTQKQFMIK